MAEKRRVLGCHELGYFCTWCKKVHSKVFYYFLIKPYILLHILC